MSQSTSFPEPPPKNPSRYSAVDPDSNPSNPYSAFYQHPSSRTSLERTRADSRTYLPPSSGDDKKQLPPKIVVTDQPDHDLEKQNTNDSDMSLDKTPVAHVKAAPKPSYSNMWPSRDELQQKALLSKKERMRRNCKFLSGLSQRQRTWIRVLLAILVIGGAVAIGIGISLAVGGGVYKSQGQQSKIPDPDNN